MLSNLKKTNTTVHPKHKDLTSGTGNDWLCPTSGDVLPHSHGPIGEYRRMRSHVSKLRSSPAHWKDTYVSGRCLYLYSILTMSTYVTTLKTPRIAQVACLLERNLHLLLLARVCSVTQGRLGPAVTGNPNTVLLNRPAGIFLLLGPLSSHQSSYFVER